MSRYLAAKELREFEWFNFTSTAPNPAFKPQFTSIMHLRKPETIPERKLRMLGPLATTCTACSMCELGLKEAVRNNEARDPHVFSNMNPSRFMVVGQNPGWNELKVSQPFVGAAGANFDVEIAKHGFSRNDFYICNTVRCYTENNTVPSEKQKERCEPFLQMEINLLKPLLVVTLGAVAFSQFCPAAVYSQSMKKITKSPKYGVSVFAVYHPSPVNFRDAFRKKHFEEQIAVLCKLITALRVKHP